MSKEHQESGYEVEYKDGRKLNLKSGGNQKSFEKALERAKQLGVVKEWKPAEPKVEAPNLSVSQQITPVNTLHHDKQALKTPDLGQQVRIGRNQGVGNVCEVPKIERKRGRSL